MNFRKVSCDYTVQPSDDGLVVDTGHCSVSIDVPVGLPIPSIVVTGSNEVMVVQGGKRKALLRASDSIATPADLLENSSK